MTTVNLSSAAYNVINRYAILAATGITGQCFVDNFNTGTTPSSGNWGSTNASVSTSITIPTGTTSPPQGSNDSSANTTTAQTQLTALKNAIGTAGTRTVALNAANGTIVNDPLNPGDAGTYNFRPYVRYTSGSTITFPSNAVLNFFGQRTDQFFFIAGSSITFNTNVQFTNGDAGSAFTSNNIFFSAVAEITSTDAIINGILIAGTQVVFSTAPLQLFGRAYAQTANVTFAGSGNRLNYEAQVTPVICFNKGTKILCNDGEKDVYRLIEDIKSGDLVKTLGHGDLPVEHIAYGAMINNPSVFHECMYRLPSSNPEFDDLVVTGGHGILKETLSEEEILADEEWFTVLAADSHIDGLYLQRAGFCKDFVQETNNDQYIFYHLSLKGEEGRRYGIWANGILSESTYKRDMIRVFGPQ